MDPKRGSILALVALPIALSLLLGGCGASSQPYRIGVVVDCVGLNRSLHDAELAGAELPLVQRGAEPRGGLAEDGVTSVDVAGREVEIVPGCTEVWEFAALTAEVRKLVERDHVDAVVAGGSGPDEIVLREVARLYPEVVFVAVASGPREVTARRRPPNLFRFAASHGQGVAGLGSYAFRTLGWRSAALVLFNWDYGWGTRDAFSAEFCGLGGRIVDRLAVEELPPAGDDAARLLRSADGVVVLLPAFTDPGGFLERLAARFRPAPRRILLGPATVDEPTVLDSTGRTLAGVVGSSTSDPARMHRYLTALRSAFPGIPAEVAGGELVSSYYDAVEAVLAGLDSAGGAPARMRAAMDGLRVGLLGGKVQMSPGGQASVPITLVRLEPGSGRVPAQATVGRIGNVDDSLGGLLAPGEFSTEVPAGCELRPRSSR